MLLQHSLQRATKSLHNEEPVSLRHTPNSDRQPTKVADLLILDILLTLSSPYAPTGTKGTPEWLRKWPVYSRCSAYSASALRSAGVFLRFLFLSLDGGSCTSGETLTTKWRPAPSPLRGLTGSAATKRYAGTGRGREGDGDERAPSNTSLQAPAPSFRPSFQVLSVSPSISLLLLLEMFEDASHARFSFAFLRR